MHILHVVGARPNFMKADPVLRALAAGTISARPWSTPGNTTMWRCPGFFSGSWNPEPDCNLEVGSGSHAQQTAEIMRTFEPVLLERKPDLVLVYGDVNSTVAAALVSSKLKSESATSKLGCDHATAVCPRKSTAC